MIFVTVGGHPHDNLIREVDRLMQKGEIKEEIIAQIADGKYTPKNIRYFDFKYPLTPYIRTADIIIATEGAGTTFGVLKEGKKLITVIGPITVDNTDIVKYFSQKGYCLWCNQLDDLVKCINKTKRKKFKKYISPPCTIHKEIEKVLNNINYT